MPTVLVVEDGTGLSTANTYLSEADADAYHTLYTGSTDWSGALTAAKERALVLATQHLDAKYHGRWLGQRANDTQALDWPRSNAEDSDGYAIDDESLPQKLKNACAELALRVVLGDSLFAPLTDPGQVVAESITVGPISESKTYAGPKPQDYQYPQVDALLRGLTESCGMVYRG